MLAHLRRYFLLPSFRTDDPDSWRPYYLRRIAVADLLATVALLPLVALTLPRPLPMIGVVLFFSLAYLLSFWASRRLPLRISARIHVVINLLFITPAIVLSGGVQSPLVIGLFVVLLTAGLLLSRPAMIRVALFLTALLTATLAADLGRWLPASMIDNEAPWFAWLAEAAMLALAGQRLFLYTWLIDNALHGAASELAERRHADASLRASEERQRRLFDTMPGSYVASTIDGRILLCNPAAARIFGYSLDEFMQLNAGDLYRDPADRAALVAQAAAAGEVRNHEVRMRRKDGTPLDIEATLNLVRDGQGRPAGVEGTLYDVTPLKQAQAALRESEANFRRLFEELPTSFIRAGLDGRILLANRAAARLFGYSLAELHAMSVVDLYADPAERAGVVQTLLAGGAVQARESRMRRKDGAVITTALTVNLVCDAQGAPIAVEGTQYDITPMKQVEDALRQNQQMLELAQAVSHVGHLTIDLSTEQVVWSPEMYRLMGVTPETYTPGQHNWFQFFAEFDRQRLVDLQREAAWEGTRTVELDIYPGTGGRRRVLLSINFLAPGSDGHRMMMCTLLDITALKAAEAAAQAQAERMSVYNEIGRSVATLRGLDAVLESIYAHVHRLVTLDVFLVGLYDADTQLVSWPVIYDGGRRYAGTESVVPEAASPITRRVIESVAPALINRTPAEIAQAARGRVDHESRPAASLIYVPLVAERGCIGYLSVQSYSLNAYDAGHVELLAGVANQTAVAIRNAQLFESAAHELSERRQAEERLHTLAEIGRSVSTMRELDDVLDAIYQQVSRLMPFDVFAVGLYDAGKEEIYWPSVYDGGVRYDAARMPVAADPLAAQVLRTGESMHIHRTPEQLAAMPRLLGDLTRNPICIVNVPLITESGVIGVMSAQSYSPTEYDPARLDLLSGIANQTAVAIRNAQLFEAAENELIERRQAEQRLSVLAEISREVSSIHTLDTVLEAIYTQVKRLMPADIFAVSLFDATRSVLRYPLFYDGDRRYETPDLPLDRLSAAMQAVLASHQPMRILRTPDEVRNAPPRITGDLSRQPASLLYAPLPGEPDSIGMLGVHSYACNAFTPTHLELLTGIANQTAVAIRNAQLFEAAENELAERRQAEERLSVVAEISREVSSIHNLDTALEAIYHRVRRVLPADVFLIGFDDAATHEIAWTTIYDGGVRYPPLRMPKSAMPLATRAMESGEPVFLHRTPAEIAAARPRVIGDPHHKPASLLFAPLIADRSTIGVMSVQSYAPDAYSPARAELLGGIANQAAAALRSAQLFDSAAHELAERRQAEERLSALLELSRAVSTRRSLEEVMAAVHAQIRQLMPVDALFVALYDAARDQVTFPYLSDGGQRYQRAPDALDNSTLLAQTIRSGQPMLLKRTPAEVAQALSRRMGDRARASASLIYLPLVVDGHTIGALSVQSYEYDRYSASHVDLLMGIAYQSAVAIRNAELFESVQQELAERRQAEERLSNLLELSREVSTHRKLDDVLDAVCHQLMRLIPHDAFFVSLYDAQTAEFSFPVVIDDGVRYAPPPHRLAGASLSARVMASGAPLLFSDGVPSGPDTPAALRLGDPSRLSQSIIVAPLALESRVFGVISVQSYEPKRYSAADVSLLVGVAYQVAIAIESARLFEALEAELAARRRAAAERETLIGQLEDRNSELERFTYTVSHDLKSPLITMRGFLGYVEQDARAGQWDRLQQDMRRINDATGKMQRLLDELLEMSRVGRQMNAPEDVPFETVAREAVALVGGRLAERNVVVQIAPDLPVVHGDRLRLVEVVQNLVDNAAKFMGSQAAPRVEIGVRMTDAGQPVFTVRDNGIGIDPRYQARVFGLFDKLDARSEGTGVGLALVKRIIEVHGGRIWVESEGSGHGSTFCFTLPAPPAPTEREDERLQP